MNLRYFRQEPSSSPELASSQLFDDRTFYPAFLKDLEGCERELTVECPFITRRRMQKLYPLFKKLSLRGVKIIINTRDPETHEYSMSMEAEEAVASLQADRK